MKKYRDSILGLLFVLPSFLLMLTIIVYPIITSVILSLTNENTGKIDFSNYQGLFKDKIYVSNVKYTLYIVIFTVVITIVISFLLALFLRFSNSKASKILEKIYLIPKFIPGIVAVYTIMLFIKDSGVLNRFMMRFGIDYKPGLMYTKKGIIMANCWFNIPFATMMISSELAGIKDSIIESARDVGASSFLILRKMIFPLVKRSIFITATFIFMGNLGSFTTPFLMGTNAPRMLGVALQQEFSVFYNPNRAAAMSVLMFIMSSIVGFSYIKSVLKVDKWA